MERSGAHSPPPCVSAGKAVLSLKPWDDANAFHTSRDHPSMTEYKLPRAGNVVVEHLVIPASDDCRSMLQICHTCTTPKWTRLTASSSATITPTESCETTSARP